MCRYRFELATHADDADLCSVIRGTPTDGPISLTFLREPSFFAAAEVEGRFRQIVVCRDLATKRIVGFGMRSIMNRYTNGESTPIGYLSGLRLLPEHRNRRLVARGYAFFRDLHADRRTVLYLTTIAEGNPALPVLTSGRAGLPRYHDAGRFFTVAIPVPRRPVHPREKLPLNIRLASSSDQSAILEFVQTEAPHRQFFPVYHSVDFGAGNGLLRGLAVENVWLACAASQPVGILGAWNQCTFKQTIVHAYSRRMRMARPILNGWERLRGRSAMPRVGEPIRYVTAALPMTARDRSAAFTSLVDHCLSALASGPADYLMIGMHEFDPLCPDIRRRGRVYVTRMYLVCWDDGERLRNALDRRPPYLELGGL